MTIPLRVLVVDDDPEIRSSLETALTLEGHLVETAVDGDDALRRHPAFAPDVVVLDLMMGGRSGLGFCRAIRAVDDPTPVLMLTARDAVDDRVRGLDAGADDYLSKPFALAELFARIRALTRRRRGPARALDAGLRLDAASRLAVRGGGSVQLTATETAVLQALLDNADQTVTRAVLVDAAWGPDRTPHSNVIEVTISSLRSKLEAGGLPRIIHTVRGLGYRLADE